MQPKLSLNELKAMGIKEVRALAKARGIWLREQDEKGPLRKKPALINDIIEHDFGAGGVDAVLDHTDPRLIPGDDDSEPMAVPPGSVVGTIGDGQATSLVPSDDVPDDDKPRLEITQYKITTTKTGVQGEVRWHVYDELGKTPMHAGPARRFINADIRAHMATVATDVAGWAEVPCSGVHEVEVFQLDITWKNGEYCVKAQMMRTLESSVETLLSSTPLKYQPQTTGLNDKQKMSLEAYGRFNRIFEAIRAVLRQMPSQLSLFSSDTRERAAAA